MNDQFIIRMAGEGMKPGLVRSREIAEVLEAIEDLVVAESIMKDASVRKDDFVVGLCEIRDQSLGLTFKTTMASLVLSVVTMTGEAINEGRIDTLTEEGIRSLETLSSFSRRHNCNAEFRFSLDGEPIAKITPETIIPKTILVEGTTSLLAEVIRVGGKHPRVMLGLASGKTLYCDVPERIAQDLGHKLYNTVTLEGRARWNSKTLEVVEFQVYDVHEFSADRPSKILEQVSHFVGSAFSGIKNVPAYVSELRGNGGMA